MPQQQRAVPHSASSPGNSPTIESVIEHAVCYGATFLPSDHFSLIASKAQPSSNEVVELNDLNLSLAGLPQLLGLLGGGDALAKVLPRKLLPNCKFVLDSTSFILDHSSESVSLVQAHVACAMKGGGVPSLHVASIAGESLEISLVGVVFHWSAPGQSHEILLGSALGRVDLFGVTFAATVSFPGGEVNLQEPKGSEIELGAVLTKFGLPNVAQTMTLSHLDFSAVPKAKSFSLSGLIDSSSGGDLSIIPDVLALQDLFFSFSHDPSSTNVKLSAQAQAWQKIVLGAQLSAQPSSDAWQLEAGLNVPATCQKLDVAANEKHQYQLPLFKLIDVFVPVKQSYFPVGLQDVNIKNFGVSYTYDADNPSSDYTFTGSCSDQWSLDAEETIQSQLSVTLGSSEKKGTASFLLGDFDFDLSVDFAQSQPAEGGTWQVDASISTMLNGNQETLSGSYVEHADGKGGVATLNLPDGLNLNDLLNWMIAHVTGNRYFSLTTPWKQLLSAVGIPSGTRLSIDTKSKTVTCGEACSVSHWGMSISSFSISYTPANAGGSNHASGFQVSVTHSGGTTTWDPLTKTPKGIPGRAPMFDLKLAAAGQHLEFSETPNNVKQAMSELSAAMSPSAWNPLGSQPATMKSAPSAGWLLASHFEVMRQVDLNMVFLDPQFYALSVKVKKSAQSATKPTKLDVLAGLYAEILYRKVSATVGEYAGTLTLPTTIRKIKYGTMDINLPSINASIYTNGDFSFDIGFPYHDDFSHSLTISAGEYAGAGGFYYAKLNGLDPKSVPQVSDTVGIFSPITELGLGVQLGLARHFSSGPLSASLSVMLAAIFQGTFAKYLKYEGAQEDEFYDIKGTLSITGRVKGEIDFAIVTASLSLVVYVKAIVDLEAHKATLVQLSAGVDVSITVSINCGFFSIHIHCHYSTSVHAQETLGHNSQALWPTPSGSPEAHLLAAKEESTTLQLSWQPVTGDLKNLNIYLVPQFTYAQSKWYYVAQLAMQVQPPTTGGRLVPDAGNPEYQSSKDFVCSILRWALVAIYGRENSSVSTSQAADLSVPLSKVKNFVDHYQSGYAPSYDDIVAQFGAGFSPQFHSEQIDGAHVGFFPFFPGMWTDTYNYQTGMEARTQDLHVVEREKNARAESSSGPSEDALKQQKNVLSKYVLLILQQGLKQLLMHWEQKHASSSSESISTILSWFDDQMISSTLGFTTRFMLSGVRVNKSDGSGTRGLYEATLQQSSFYLYPLHQGPQYLGMEVHISESDAKTWGIKDKIYSGQQDWVIAQGLSAGENPLLLMNAWFQGTVDIGDLPFSTSSLPDATQDPVYYHVKPVLLSSSPGNRNALYQFPRGMQKRMRLHSNEDSDVTFVQIKNKDRQNFAESISDAPTLQGNGVITIDLSIQRIRQHQKSAPGNVSTLKNTFHLDKVGQDTFDALRKVLQSNQTPTGMTIGYATPSSQGNRVAHTVSMFEMDFTHCFFLADQVPSVAQPLPAQETPNENDFLSSLEMLLLYASGDSKQCYLYIDEKEYPFPAKFFDSSGRAQISLSLIFNSLSSHCTGVFLAKSDLEADCEILACSSHWQATKATLPVNALGLQVQRTATVKPPAISGQPSRVTVCAGITESVQNMYNTVEVSLLTVGSTQIPQPAKRAFLTPKHHQPPTEGRLNVAAGANDSWKYEHVFDFAPDFIAPEVPEEPVTNLEPDELYNPYALIGQQPTIKVLPTDFFGNQMQAFTANNFSPLGYRDPVVSLHQLPYLKLKYFLFGGEFRLLFDWNPPSYEAGQEKIRENDLKAYAMAYYQLGGPEVQAELSLSVFPDHTLAVSTTSLRNNLKRIYCALVNCVPGASNGSACKPWLPQIKVDLPAITEHSINAKLMYTLNAVLTVKRTKYIDPAFTEDAKVKTCDVSIAPFELYIPATGAESLVSFAMLFEWYFLSVGLKLAMGPKDESQEHKGKSQKIWIVRYDNPGLQLQFDNPDTPPTYFAPRPLSNQLLSRKNVPIPSADAQGNFDASTEKTVDVRNFNLDASMRSFMVAVDRLFDPASRIPAALLNSTTLNQLAADRSAIASKIKRYVCNLDTGSSYNPNDETGNGTALNEAARVYQDACQDRLENFYRMNAAVVVNPTVTLPTGIEQLARLSVSGQPVVARQKGAENSNIHVSPQNQTAHTGLTGGVTRLKKPSGQPPATTAMGFGFYAKDAAHEKEYKESMNFSVTGIELELGDCEVGEISYPLGTWLHFIVPPKPTSLGEIDLKIPLRQFPVPPRLESLNFEPSAVPSQEDNQNKRLEYAKGWDLLVGYNLQPVAQDTLCVTLQQNLAPSVSSDVTSAPPQIDLLEALVQFQALAPKIEDKLGTHLTSIRSPQNPSSDASSVNSVRKALKSFASLVHNVADSTWPGEQPPQQSMAATSGGEVAALQSDYQISVGSFSKGTDPWQLEVRKVSGNIDGLPVISLPGYTTQVKSPSKGVALCTFVEATDSGAVLTVENAWGIRSHALKIGYQSTLQQSPFNILLRHNAQVEMHVLRNANFPSSFHYKTATLTYKQKLIPILHRKSEINVAGLGESGGTPSPRALVKHLTALFYALLNNSNGGGQTIGSLQVATSLSYPVSNSISALGNTAVPMEFRLPVSVTFGEPSSIGSQYISDMANAISHWLSKNGISKTSRPEFWKEASIVFDMTFFSDLSTKGEPILKMSGIELPCHTILTASP